MSPSARTPGSPGPLIYYGKHPNRPFKDASDVAFLEARCSGGLDGEGTRISGFRAIGPDPGDQRTFETGINIMDCHDVEISNMEVANWGGTAVKVQNPAQGAVIPSRDPAEILVRIHDNFIHDAEIVPVWFGFAGRFGAAPGGGTMIIDEHRRGRFFSKAEAAVGASPSWTSVYQY